MKISIIVVEIAMTLSIAIPFIYFIMQGGSSKRKIQNTLNKLTKKESFNWMASEQWNNKFIGIDNTNKLLFITAPTKGEPIVELLDIGELKSCKIVKSDRFSEVYNSKFLECVDVVLDYRNGPDSTLNFFDVDVNHMENLELKRAEKWQKMIQERIPATRVLRRAA